MLSIRAKYTDNFLWSLFLYSDDICVSLTKMCAALGIWCIVKHFTCINLDVHNINWIVFDKEKKSKIDNNIWDTMGR